ncbi:MAG: DUF1906 domain-containing protein [Firmicutes bacterium]|nr:DUF1906 domain-containing protein [Bacillota bacterium]
MGQVVTLAAHSHGVDLDGALGTSAVGCLLSHGILFVGRYVPLLGQPLSGCLTAAEAAAVTEHGVAIAVVQHGRLGPYVPTPAAQGAADGDAAVSYLKRIGAPTGLYVYVDVENPDESVSNSVAYAVAWSTAVAGSGIYLPAVYSGPRLIRQSTAAGAAWYATWSSPCFGSLAGFTPNILQFPTGICGSTAVLCGAIVDPDLTQVATGGFWGR